MGADGGLLSIICFSTLLLGWGFDCVALRSILGLGRSLLVMYDICVRHRDVAV
jgi:hypothetical protein